MTSPHSVGLAGSSPPASARSLGGCFGNESGNYLSLWSPKELWVLLTAKGRGISSENSTSVCSRVQRLKLLEGLASDVSKDPSFLIEMNLFSLFFLPEMSHLAHTGVTLSLFFAEVWGCLLTWSFSMKHLLWGQLMWNRREKAKVRIGFAWVSFENSPWLGRYALSWL